MKRTLIIALGLGFAAAANAQLILDTYSSGNDFLSTTTTRHESIGLSGGAYVGASTRILVGQVGNNPQNRFNSQSVANGNWNITNGSGVESTSSSYIIGQGSTSGNSLPNFANYSPLSPVLDLTGYTTIEVDVLFNDLASTLISVSAWDSGFANSDVSSQYAVAVGSSTISIPVSDLINTVPGSDIGTLGLHVYTPSGADVIIGEIRAVPEPASMLALGAGIAALAARRRRK